MSDIKIPSTDHLTRLGESKTTYRYDNPGSDILETFRAPTSDVDKSTVQQIISIDFPELTSLCPVTGQPDFGRIILEYLPDQKCIESKSIKLYFGAYRNHRAFMESMTASMLNDFKHVTDPLWMRVCGIFNARGGTHLHAFSEYYRPGLNDIVVKRVAEWKATHNFTRTGGFNR